MGLFNRKDRVIDLTRNYERQQERAREMKEDMKDSQGSDAGGLGFFGAIANTSSSSDSPDDSGYINISNPEERKRKLAKRLMEMTSKIEDLSNQIYHLQQRIEVLERKLNVSSF